MLCLMLADIKKTSTMKTSNNFFSLVILLTMFCSCNNTQQKNQSYIFQDTFITDTTIGVFCIGADIGKLISVTKTPYNIKKEKYIIEGDSETIYNVYRSGQKIIAFYPNENDSTKIFRISIYNSKFKTHEGVAVGSTFGELKSKYAIDFISTEGEGGLEVQVQGHKMFFMLDNSKIPKDWWQSMDTKIIPDSIPINEIIL